MNRFKNYRQVLNHFRDTTLIHALPHTKNSISKHFRLFWAFAFVLGAIALGFQLVTAWQTYISYPVQVKLFLQTSRSLTFPSVTFCNLNPVKRSMLRCTDMDDLVAVQQKLSNTAGTYATLMALLKENNTDIPAAYIQPSRSEYVCNGTTVVMNPNPLTTGTNTQNNVQQTPITNLFSPLQPTSTNTTNTTGTTSTAGSPASGPPGFGLLSSMNMSSTTFYRDLIAQTQVTDLSNLLDLAAVTENQAYMYGYTADDLLVDCSYDGALCVKNEFGQSYNRRFGLCYTFNNGKVKPAFNTTKWGSRYGLRVSMNINISEYLGLLAPEAGVSVSLQSPGILPVPEMIGISAMPGYTTSISFSLTHITRQPYPYPSNCISDFPAAYTPYLPNSTVYSLQACQIACVQAATFESCGCVDQLPLAKYPQCSIRNATQRQCWSDVSDKQFLPVDNQSALICQCYPACEENKFVTSVSHSKYPSPAYGLVKTTNFLTRDGVGRFWVGKYNKSGNADNFLTPQWIPDISPESNLLRVHVYYSDLNYQLVEEVADYPLERCLSDCGGIFGLYLGVSVSVLFEIVELAVMLVTFACTRKKDIPTNTEPAHIYDKISY